MANAVRVERDDSNEFALGLKTTQSGAARFASGTGRGGRFDDI